MDFLLETDLSFCFNRFELLELYSFCLNLIYLGFKKYREDFHPFHSLFFYHLQGNYDSHLPISSNTEYLFVFLNTQPKHIYLGCFHQCYSL